MQCREKVAVAVAVAVAAAAAVRVTVVVLSGTRDVTHLVLQLSMLGLKQTTHVVLTWPVC